MSVEETRDMIVGQWLLKADSDLRSARFLRGMSETELTTDTICFHCQQTVEKLHKAFSVSSGVDFRKEHNLEYLLELCRRSDPAFKEFDFGRMSEYGVVVRYPAEFYMPSADEADTAIQTTQVVDTYVRSRLAGRYRQARDQEQAGN